MVIVKWRKPSMFRIVETEFPSLSDAMESFGVESFLIIFHPFYRKYIVDIWHYFNDVFIPYVMNFFRRYVTLFEGQNYYFKNIVSCLA